jgi:hypothetical protein
MYRVGFPGWKLAARLGVPLGIRVDVRFDKESHSYWAVSPDLDGLSVSGLTLDELRNEVRGAAIGLLELAIDGQPAFARPEMRFKDDIICAV